MPRSRGTRTPRDGGKHREKNYECSSFLLGNKPIFQLSTFFYASFKIKDPALRTILVSLDPTLPDQYFPAEKYTKAQEHSSTPLRFPKTRAVLCKKIKP